VKLLSTNGHTVGLATIANKTIPCYLSQLAPSLLLDLLLVLETHEVYQWHICLSCELNEIDVQL